ncbi:MAG: ribonuclease HI [Microcoleus sp. PH2017_10_PVI_O_A]|uniref:ribonuclease HI n=1 Tax=unclassified Microcoleus TaxID=2642155 RepID=UPI001E10A9B2|nr:MULTISPECIES: ribonuclease HI [unclassified Microcoleus]TAE82785.1 MAG: ribonuclease HI [Oscillatoriales cyanobacterium]MCC3406620.1 ribonuclease HI [Microcoleus sp. PH2017_10_PVI_O_A]MCC3460632.1 ribonuclease HI [Microcoleus sp. PH2017_11_PCY_U_A]MCC3479179.1 ribonuclease HI [Microcoleus sp. PH2017_12_PCY_D_A]MCC3526543.1 ribonuclease HI [Microcoleus sp. PH2017_21_RUC_O_A]
MTTPTIKSLYTDGACSGNPGPGGWGAVVCFADGKCHELGGGDPQTTNNRMEMQAAVAALEFFANSGQTEPVTVYTDSEYVKNGITKWIQGWKNKGWKTSTGKDVVNQDLWHLLDKLNSRQIKWEHVRGHSGDFYNDRCDEIARSFSHNRTPQLQQHKPTADEAGANREASPPDIENPIVLEETDTTGNKTIESYVITSDLPISNSTMMDSTADTLENLPREVRVQELRNLIETLHIADEVATKGYLITSSELADLMDVNASAVTSRGDNWVWRNWVVSRVRREGNQILWQLERIDHVSTTD